MRADPVAPPARPHVTGQNGYVTPTETRPVGLWLDTPDGLHWWLDPGSLALDLAYTGDLGGGERIGTPAALAAWLEPRFAEADGVVGDGDVRDALALRDAIARAATAVAASREPEPGDVDAINLYAAIPDIPPVLEGGTRRAGRSTARTSQALAVVARDAVRLLSPGEAGRDRIRVCDADDCTIVFADDSRSRSRRWCSMARCGNRAKVRAYRSRARSAG